MAFGGCHSRESFKNLNAVTEAIYKALPSGSLSIHKSVVTWNSMGMWFNQAPWAYQSLDMVQKNRSMRWDRMWDTWKRKEVPESGCSVGRSSMGRLQDETTNQWSGKAFFGSMLWMGENRRERAQLRLCEPERRMLHKQLHGDGNLTLQSCTHTHNCLVRFPWLKVQT